MYLCIKIIRTMQLKSFTIPLPLIGFCLILLLSSATHIEIPKTNSNDTIITHTGFSLLYNEKHEQAKWVAYVLTADRTQKRVERSNKFTEDPKILTKSATNTDYKGSGFDRGHLAPATDMAWSSTSMQESFYYSNMSPQVPSFNRGIWKKLEELIRIWAMENDSLYIVTGPIFTENMQSIGPNKVSVPKYYYKVILDYHRPEIKGIGFIIPNDSSNLHLSRYAVTIDSVESVTGLDFFFTLPDKEEIKIEKEICIECWTWGERKRK